MMMHPLARAFLEAEKSANHLTGYEEPCPPEATARSAARARWVDAGCPMEADETATERTTMTSAMVGARRPPEAV